jgi:hypothetical protein
MIEHLFNIVFNRLGSRRFHTVTETSVSDYFRVNGSPVRDFKCCQSVTQIDAIFDDFDLHSELKKE